jgi:hypothetical protein
VPDADVIYGDLRIVDEQLLPKSECIYRDWYGENAALLPAMLRGNAIPDGGTLIHRSCYDRAGLYDTSFPRAHDYEWWTRLLKQASFRHIPHTTYLWRWHDSNMSTGSVPINRGYEKQIILSMLSRYQLEELFPHLEWSGQEAVQSYARAMLELAGIMFNLGEKLQALVMARKSLIACPSTEADDAVRQISDLLENPDRTI